MATTTIWSNPADSNDKIVFNDDSTNAEYYRFRIDTGYEFTVKRDTPNTRTIASVGGGSWPGVLEVNGHGQVWSHGNLTMVIDTDGNSSSDKFIIAHGSTPTTMMTVTEGGDVVIEGALTIGGTELIKASGDLTISIISDNRLVVSTNTENAAEFSADGVINISPLYVRGNTGSDTFILTFEANAVDGEGWIKFSEQGVGTWDMIEFEESLITTHQVLHAKEGFRVETVTADPSSPVVGRMTFNTSNNKLSVYNGGSWKRVQLS